MIKLLRKEIQLAASPLSYFFIGFGLMAFVPGYPILVGSFFVCLGLFQSFQTAREANDLTYTALLPVAKRDVVRAKYAFCCFIEICYFTLTGAVTLIRMTLLSNAAVYRNNVLMNKFAKPFVKFIIAAFAVVGLGETLFHIPGLAALSAFGFAHMGLQLGILALGILLFSGLTVLSKHRAMRNFERIDL